MPTNLHELLEGDEPVALQRIERALQSGKVHNEVVDITLSALIWRRCTTSPNGVLGAVLSHDCAARVDVLAQHLDRIGATDSAQALRDLRNEIPFEDERIKGGIIDWIDINPQIARHAASLDSDVDDVAPALWNFMQECQAELPNPEIPDKKTGLWAGLFKGWIHSAERPN